MAKFMLIGGGNVGRGDTEYETSTIDREIVKMSEKDNPKFLFIGLASSFSDSYYKTIKKIYSELGCECAYLKKKNLLNNPDIVEDKILGADIIYFCGGDSIKLVEKIKDYKLDSLLEKAINNNTVLAGMSAGAIMMCKEGYSDSRIIRSESDKYEFVPGINFLNISFCPHYNSDNQKGKELVVDLENSDTKILAVNDRCAIKIINDKYEVISEDNNSHAYICSNDEKFKIEKLEKTGLVSKIVL